MTPLESYEQACQWLADHFIEKYWGKTETETWWVANHIGGVLFVNDLYFDMTDISEFLRSKYTRKEMFGYCDYRGEFYTGENEHGSPINIWSWKRLKK